MEIKPFEKKVWLSTPTMHGDELRYVTEAYETNWMSTVGQNINEAERIVAEKLGCKYAVGLASGTAALHLCMKLAGIKPGVKVFCSDVTFAATVNPVLYEGGIPVFINCRGVLRYTSVRYTARHSVSSAFGGQSKTKLRTHRRPLLHASPVDRDQHGRHGDPR